jgi:hypothetical protein
MSDDETYKAVVVACHVDSLFIEEDAVTRRFVEVAFPSVVFPVTASVPATETLPAESMVVVAVPPKYALVNTDCTEVDAFPNVCRPLQMFAFATLSESVPPPSERPEPTVVVAICPASLPVSSVFAARLAHPVPPFAGLKMFVTSDVRFTSEVEIAPPVAFKIPLKLPTDSEPKNPWVDDA